MAMPHPSGWDIAMPRSRRWRRRKADAHRPRVTGAGAAAGPALLEKGQQPFDLRSGAWWVRGLVEEDDRQHHRSVQPVDPGPRRRHRIRSPVAGQHLVKLEAVLGQACVLGQAAQLEVRMHLDVRRDNLRAATSAGSATIERVTSAMP